MPFKLEHTARGSWARAGTFATRHGEVRTPTFMPVATQAAVRSQTFDCLRASGAQMLLSNTYHLYLRPGTEVLKRVGGFHGLTGWTGPLLTDSGGFQVFSLAKFLEMSEEGASFSSHLDGKKILLTPELSIETQKQIGSDIMMVLDQCIPALSNEKTALDAMELTHRWALRSLAARGDSHQALFAIVQGACFENLREKSAEFLTQHPFDGFAVGGVAVGESKDRRDAIIRFVSPLLPDTKPRYLMGVGTPLDLLESVHAGMDMFDCILPTALAQQGVAYTSNGKVDLRRGAYRFSETAIDQSCPCSTCANHSRAFLHHLTKAREILGWQLIGYHNVYFYQSLMAQMRQAILADKFVELYHQMRPRLAASDEEHPITPPKSRTHKKRPTVMGNFEIVVSATRATLKHTSGETIHSTMNPDSEASRLYTEQSRLAERLDPSNASPLVVWDVGLGAGHNAMAAIRVAESAAEKIGFIRPMELISFEIDLDAIRLALYHPGFFPHLNHGAPRIFLAEGEWTSSVLPLSWRLIRGDFLETLGDAPAPDLVFFDPFSYKTDSALWSMKCFKKLFERSEDKSTLVFTYSASTAVRAGLLGAGFYVGKGAGTGPKSDTTIALTPIAAKSHPEIALLGADWLDRWRRSDNPYPADTTDSGAKILLDLIPRHAQFRKS